MLFFVEFAIMWYLNKYHPAEEYEIRDVGAVDLTPWKYVKPAALTCFILMLCVYALFSPIGLAR